MRSRTTRAVAVILGAALAALGLSACSQGGTGDKVQLTYWTFTDYASGTAGELQRQLISEFEKTNPNISVKVVGKTGSDISSGVVATAGQPTAPDVITGQLANGGLLVKAGALKDISSEWSASNASYRSEFNADFVKDLGQNGHTWGVPYTSYSTVLYRNLAVLQAAGIDPAAGVKDWSDWLDQMKKVKESGGFGLANPFATYWEALSYYGGVPNASFALTKSGTSSTLSAPSLAKALSFMTATQQYGSPVATGDQAETDLFTSNKLAYIVSGPWLDPSLQQAAAKGLKYDQIPVPGEAAGQTGGTRGGEFLAVASGSQHSEAAWKFVQFMTEAKQAQRFAVGLGRSVANDTAMSSPAAAAVPLLKVTATAFKTAVDESPLMADIPTNAFDALNNAVTAVKSGQNPQTASSEAVSSFNNSIKAG